MQTSMTQPTKRAAQHEEHREALPEQEQCWLKARVRRACASVAWCDKISAAYHWTQLTWQRRLNLLDCLLDQHLLQFCNSVTRQ